MNGLAAAAQKQAPVAEDCKDELRYSQTTGALTIMDPCMGVSHGAFRITKDTLCQQSEVPAQLVVAVIEKNENEFERSFQIREPHGIFTWHEGRGFPTSLFDNHIIGKPQDDLLVMNYQYVSSDVTHSQTAFQTTGRSQKIKEIPGCFTPKPAK